VPGTFETWHLLDFAVAALTGPRACCIHAIFDTATIRPGDWTLVSGPGTVGLVNLQLVKAAGGRSIVAGTTGDRPRIDLARELGAEQVVDVFNTGLDELVADLAPAVRAST
jgi:L-iditol 2-dehydrogenase